MEQARQLLAEAGYADGFEITLTPAIRGVADEIEATEAIATMWEEIGVRAKLQKVPYSTIRPEFVSRTYQGATLHGASTFHLEPFNLWLLTMNTESRFSMGLEHQFIDERLKKVAATLDREGRLIIQREMTQSLFDNVLGVSLYTVNVVWPLSEKIDVWKPRRGDTRQISNLEIVPHRK